MERTVALNGGNATIYLRWISLLESMSWHAKALVVRFFLADEYSKQDRPEAAIKVYEDLLEAYSNPQPTKLPSILFNSGFEKYELDTPGNLQCVMLRPIMLHVLIADKLLPLLKAAGKRDPYKQLLLKMSEGCLRHPDMAPAGAQKLENLQMAGIAYLGSDDELWNLLAQVQLLLGKIPQAGSSYVNAARCCGLAGDNEAAEWYLNKSTEVGSVEGMMALIDFLRDKEDTYKSIIARQHKELVTIRRMTDGTYKALPSGARPHPPLSGRRANGRPASTTPPHADQTVLAAHTLEDGEWLGRCGRAVFRWGWRAGRGKGSAPPQRQGRGRAWGWNGLPGIRGAERTHAWAGGCRAMCPPSVSR